MPSISFSQAGKKGKNPGIYTNSPPNTVQWSVGRNVRFRPGAVYKTFGKTLITTIPQQSAIRNIFTFQDINGITRHIVCCDNKVYAYTSVTTNFNAYTDITPATPPAGTAPVWQFALVGGLPVLTNGDKIWTWNSFSSVLTLWNPTVALTGTSYSSPAPRILIGHQNRLFIGGATDSGQVGHGRMAWSGIANANHMDFSPDAGNNAAFGRAGKQDFISTKTDNTQLETLVGSASMGSNLFVFTERNLWVMRPIGSPHDFSLYQLPYDDVGLYHNRAVVVVNRPQGHGIYYMGNNDFYHIAGEEIKAIGLPIRNACFSNLNKSAQCPSFAFYNPSTFEVWFCVATANNTYPDTAFVYNVELENWSICDCTFLCHSTSLEANMTSWATISTAWTDTGVPWTDLTANGVLPYSIAGDINGRIFKLDSAVDDTSSALSTIPISSYIETGDIGNGERRIKFNELTPNFRAQSSANNVMIQVGVRESLSDPITWGSPQTFTLGASRKIMGRNEGAWLRLRIYSDNLSSSWTLEGYSLTYTLGGTR